jgi:hypothetical protein
MDITSKVTWRRVRGQFRVYRAWKSQEFSLLGLRVLWHSIGFKQRCVSNM